MPTDEGFMQEAIAEARRALEHADTPIGAVVVHGGEVVSRGHNAQELRGDATAHAEIIALRAASEAVGGWRLDGCTIYVTVEPCPMCAGAIVAHRVERLVFGAWNPKAGACGSLYNIVEDPRLNHQVTVVRGVLSEECAKPLSDFFGTLRSSDEL